MGASSTISEAAARTPSPAWRPRDSPGPAAATAGERGGANVTSGHNPEEGEVTSVDIRAIFMELMWRCTACGHLIPKAEPLPDECPGCGGQKGDFVFLTED